MTTKTQMPAHSEGYGTEEPQASPQQRDAQIPYLTMLSEGKLEELEKVARELSRFRLRRGLDHWRLYHDDLRIDGPWKDDELQLADDALHLAQAKAAAAIFDGRAQAAEAELAALRAQAPAPVGGEVVGWRVRNADGRYFFASNENAAFWRDVHGFTIEPLCLAALSPDPTEGGEDE